MWMSTGGSRVDCRIFGQRPGASLRLLRPPPGGHQFLLVGPAFPGVEQHRADDLRLPVGIGPEDGVGQHRQTSSVG